MTVGVPVGAGGGGAEVEAEEAGAWGRGPGLGHGGLPRPGKPRGRLPRQRQVVGLLVVRGVNEISRIFSKYLEPSVNPTELGFNRSFQQAEGSNMFFSDPNIVI